MDRVVTGEAVALDLRLAALPSRMLAAGLDSLIQGIALLVLLGTVFATLDGASEAAQAAAGLTVVVLVLVGYPVVIETLTRGTTPGKMALGLRVVRDDGGPIGFRQALVRGLVGASIEGPAVSYLPAMITMLINRRSKRLGDLLAGTVVMHTRVVGGGAPVAYMPRGMEHWALTADLSRVPDDLALAVRSFLARSADLTPAARESLGAQLLQQVLAVTSPPPPPDAPGWAVLTALLAERRRREEQRLGLAPAPSGPWYAGGPPPTAAPPYPAPPPTAPQPRPQPPASGPPARPQPQGEQQPQPEPEQQTDPQTDPQRGSQQQGAGGFVAPS